MSPNHRLRLELTTQTPADIYPATAVPPKNDAVPCRLTAPQRATVPGGVYIILYGPKWPSTLNLPQAPWKITPAVRAGVLPTSWSESLRRMADRGLGDKLFALPLDWGTDEQ